MTTTTTTARETAVDLPGGLQLQLALTLDPDGAPGLLLISIGSAEVGWRLRRDSLVVSGKVLPDIIAALQALQPEGDR